MKRLIIIVEGQTEEEFIEKCKSNNFIEALNHFKLNKKSKAKAVLTQPRLCKTSD